MIGGFTLPSKGTVGIGALLLGYYDDGKLRYAGRTGTGFTQATHRLLRAKLERLARKDSPFADVPREMQRGAHWVKPELVAQIEFSTWTRDNLVRQAAFKGLREDKPAKEVARESAVATNRTKHAFLDDQKGSAGSHSSRGRKRRNIRVKRPGNHRIPTRCWIPESGMTKLQLAEYYDGGCRASASPHC